RGAERDTHQVERANAKGRSGQGIEVRDRPRLSFQHDASAEAERPFGDDAVRWRLFCAGRSRDERACADQPEERKGGWDPSRHCFDRKMYRAGRSSNRDIYALARIRTSRPDFGRELARGVMAYEDTLARWWLCRASNPAHGRAYRRVAEFIAASFPQ